MDLDPVSLHKDAKKEAIFTEQARSIKYLVHMEKKKTIFLGDATGNPERARFRHLARSGSQSQCKIWLITPPHGASHIIKVGYGLGVLIAIS